MQPDESKRYLARTREAHRDLTRRNRPHLHDGMAHIPDRRFLAAGEAEHRQERSPGDSLGGLCGPGNLAVRRVPEPPSGGPGCLRHILSRFIPGSSAASDISKSYGVV